MSKPTNFEEYIAKQGHFRVALFQLREIILPYGMEENIKWGVPVYSIKGKNVLGIHAFKNHFGIWFYNGVFLKDNYNLLEKGSENTKGMRSMKFHAQADINEKIVSAYVKEAIQNQEAGKELKPEKSKTLVLPELLANELTKQTLLNEQFRKLTPYKQREFAEYISGAKRKETQLTRLEKCKKLIAQGLGLNDKYRDC